MQNIGEVEHSGKNASDTGKFVFFSATVVNSQGNVEIDKNFVVVNLKTVKITRGHRRLSTKILMKITSRKVKSLLSSYLEWLKKIQMDHRIFQNS